jgi:formate dehydrogenase major subunit
VAGIAETTLGAHTSVDWQAWSNDYAHVGDAIAQTYPEIFYDFNQRLWKPGGFHRSLSAAERKRKTRSSKAEFMVPESLEEDPDLAERSVDDLRLFTVRCDSQFNTTIYGHDDRFGLAPGADIVLETRSTDAGTRRVARLKIVAFDLPEGCVAGYYPECNPRLPRSHYAKPSKVPAAKSVPVRIVA